MGPIEITITIYIDRYHSINVIFVMEMTNNLLGWYSQLIGEVLICLNGNRKYEYTSKYWR